MTRMVSASLATAAMAALTIALWNVLERHEVQQIARIVQSESYAARSRLVRDVDTMLRAFRQVNDYWARFGHLPADQWSSDADIELDHFDGVELMLWKNVSTGTSYIRTPDQPAWNVHPTAEQLDQISSVLGRAPDSPGGYMLGPFAGEDGRITYDVFIASEQGSDTAFFLAIVDVDAWITHIFRDISPGYMIRVADGETLLFERDTAAPDIPESWRPSGKIRNEFGVIWSVEHAPTADLVETLKSSAESFVVLTGLLISVLLGSLILASGKATERANEAVAAQRELARLNAELEDLVQDRTSELEQRTEDLETVFFSVGHDLRSPLNSVNLSAQLMRELAADEPISERMSSAIQSFGASVWAMNDKLKQVLEMAHVIEDELVHEPIDMRALVTDVIAQLSSLDDGPPVDFRVGEMPDATGHPAMIRTLFHNLLGNALKFIGDQADRRIEVGAETVEGVTEYFVRDNGQGFDSDSAEGMFDAFQRLQNARRKEGTGLGLYIVARIVRRHGGDVRAEGVPGVGATVYFTLGPSADEASA
jgi:signal transduction histidine kinase